MPIESSNEPESFKSFEHEVWDTVSSEYERQFGRLTVQSAAALLDAANVADGTRMLDACCGPGILSAEAAKRGAQPVGVDFSDSALEIARSSVAGAIFQQGDAESLSFERDSFDAVVCGFGVIHVPEPAKALKEFRRVVRPGGRVAISTWQGPKPSNGFGLLFGAIKMHGNLDVPLPHGPDMFQFSEVEMMSAALEEVGLSGVEVIEAEQTWDFEDSIREAVRSGMNQFKTNAGTYRVPMPAVIGVGQK
jgi:SAM-dependent methyltransferase